MNTTTAHQTPQNQTETPDAPKKIHNTIALPAQKPLQTLRNAKISRRKQINTPSIHACMHPSILEIPCCPVVSCPYHEKPHHKQFQHEAMYLSKSEFPSVPRFTWQKGSLPSEVQRRLEMEERTLEEQREKEERRHQQPPPAQSVPA